MTSQPGPRERATVSPSSPAAEPYLGALSSCPLAGLLVSAEAALHARSSRQQEAETRSSSIYTPASQRTPRPSAPSGPTAPPAGGSAVLTTIPLRYRFSCCYSNLACV